MTTLRVAVAQLDLSGTDSQTRLGATVEAIERAGAASADLVVLPELAACGYVLDRSYLQQHAEPADASGSLLGAWAAAALRHDLAVLGGFAEAGAGGALYNSAVLIDPQSGVCGHYRKLHLFASEHEVLQPGDLGLPVARAPRLADATVGMAVCYDLRFPEVWRILALQGAELIAVPTAWVGGFDVADRDAARPIPHVEGVYVLANLNQVAAACADQVGSSGPHQFLGRSVVVDAHGNPLAGPLPADAPDLVTAEVDLAAVRAAWERGPGVSPRSNRRVDVYAELLGYRLSQPAEEPPGG